MFDTTEMRCFSIQENDGQRYHAKRRSDLQHMASTGTSSEGTYTYPRFNPTTDGLASQGCRVGGQWNGTRVRVRQMTCHVKERFR
jgi:hypothetical protein